MALGCLVVILAVIAPPDEVKAGLNVWTSAGPEGGDITALAVDPQAPGVLYAGGSGAGGGGVFKSATGASFWTPANSGLSNQDVRALVIDPQTPATLYAGTFGGVFKSTNDAASWSPSNTGLSNLRVQALAVSPSGICLDAGTGSGAFDFGSQLDAGCPRRPRW